MSQEYVETYRTGTDLVQQSFKILLPGLPNMTNQQWIKDVLCISVDGPVAVGKFIFGTIIDIKIIDNVAIVTFEYRKIVDGSEYSNANQSNRIQGVE